MATESLTVYPGVYKTDSYKFNSIKDETNPVGKGSSNTTCATITLSPGQNAETWIYWPFDLSSIPSSATIDSVSCSAKASSSNTTSSKVTQKTMQLCAGTTNKGSSNSIGTIDYVYSLTCGTWTRDELRDCCLKLYAKRGTSSTSIGYSINFYGADLTVTYTYQSEKFMLKTGGAWVDVAHVFKKVSGIWVEQTDLSSVVDDGVKLVNGGEINN